MPVAIAGMHRSGSSLIARLLNLCGLDLGPEDQLMPPAPDNSEGFWESLPFVHINENIIGQFGGWWDRPSQPLPGWETDALLDPWREMARGLPDLLRLTEPWGWKDPRNSLTLPFWRELWPELKVVICVRNPLEVANSLLLRDQFSVGKSLKLWFEYYRRSLDSVAPESAIVTHYDAFFIDPAAELGRLVEFLHLPADAQTVSAACAAVASELRHSQLGIGDLTEAGVTAELADLYAHLCREGGPVFARRPTGESKRPSAFARTVRFALEYEMLIEAHEMRIRQLEWLLQRTQIERDEFKATGEDRARRVRALEDRLSARRHRYAERVAGLLMQGAEPLPPLLPEPAAR